MVAAVEALLKPVLCDQQALDRCLLFRSPLLSHDGMQPLGWWSRVCELF